MGVVSLVTTVLMAYLLGARNIGLLVVTVAGFFPVAMFVGWIGLIHREDGSG
jgi:ABC-type multidrug transport system permease subunit